MPPPFPSKLLGSQFWKSAFTGATSKVRVLSAERPNSSTLPGVLSCSRTIAVRMPLLMVVQATAGGAMGGASAETNESNPRPKTIGAIILNGRERAENREQRIVGARQEDFAW